MAKYRNIPQATKDNILHYVNQVYDEAYELGYQHGIRQGKSDIEKTQRMIEAAVESLQELTINQTNEPDDIPCGTCEYFNLAETALPCCECMYSKGSNYKRRAEQ